MIRKQSFFGSTIGRKQLVALTGLGLALFVLTHMAGNLLIFVGPQAYNEYSHALISNHLIYFAEAGLLGAFAFHALYALWITVVNWKARPQSYAVAASGEKGTSLIARMMWVQGLVVLVFVVIHLLTFKFGPHYSVNYGHGEIRDLYRLVVEVFGSGRYVAWYTLSLVLLGLHLSHGVKSMLQTFGTNHPKYNCFVKALSGGYAVLITAGFLSPMIFVHFFKAAQ